MEGRNKLYQQLLSCGEDVSLDDVVSLKGTNSLNVLFKEFRSLGLNMRFMDDMGRELEID